MVFKGWKLAVVFLLLALLLYVAFTAILHSFLELSSSKEPRVPSLEGVQTPGAEDAIAIMMG